MAKRDVKVIPLPKRLAEEGKAYCGNYRTLDLTCIRCLENGEKQYRGCKK